MAGLICGDGEGGVVAVDGGDGGDELGGDGAGGRGVDAHLVHVGVAEEGEADDVGEVGEGVGEVCRSRGTLPGAWPPQTSRWLVKVE